MLFSRATIWRKPRQFKTSRCSYIQIEVDWQIFIFAGCILLTVAKTLFSLLLLLFHTTHCASRSYHYYFKYWLTAWGWSWGNGMFAITQEALGLIPNTIGWHTSDIPVLRRKRQKGSRKFEPGLHCKFQDNQEYIESSAQNSKWRLNHTTSVSRSISWLNDLPLHGCGTLCLCFMNNDVRNIYVVWLCFLLLSIH